jgi:GT2 family glycosyltransferase
MNHDHTWATRTLRHQCHPKLAASYQAFDHEKYAEAVGLLEELIRELRSKGELLNDIGVCRLLAGDPERAREAWREAAQILGKRSAPHLNLAYMGNLGAAASSPEAACKRSYTIPNGSIDLASTLVSIIILDYKNPTLTLNCLRSLKAAEISIPFEVILVDNSEGDPPRDFAQLADLPNLTYRKADRNLGFSRGCNQGASLARGELLHFVNNDTLFQKGCVEELARVLLLDRQAGIVGSKLLYGDGSIQHAGVVFAAINGDPVHRCRFKPSTVPAANLPLVLQAVTGASLMIRRERFVEFTGFCEEYVNGYEDLDLCLRIGKAGHTVIYNPRSVLYHLESKSKGRTDHEAHNHALFSGRWSKDIVRDELDYLSRNERFLLSYSDDREKSWRRRRIYAYCAHLLTHYPAMMSAVSLASIERYKHVRVYKFCHFVFHRLLRGGDRAGARAVFRYFARRYWYRPRYLRDMISALRHTS